MTRAYHATLGSVLELPLRAYYCSRKAMVLGGDGGLAMQPHVPDRLDPWGPGILELTVLRVRWIVYPHSFLAQESRKVPEREVHLSVWWARGTLPPSHLVWVQMYKNLCRVYNLYV